MIYRRCKLLYQNEVIVLIICTTQRERLANSQDCNKWILDLSIVKERYPGTYVNTHTMEVI